VEAIRGYTNAINTDPRGFLTILTRRWWRRIELGFQLLYLAFEAVDLLLELPRHVVCEWAKRRESNGVVSGWGE
jgi:hypothetical protein